MRWTRGYTGRKEMCKIAQLKADKTGNGIFLRRTFLTEKDHLKDLGVDGRVMLKPT